MPLTIACPAFADSQVIPAQYTCDGANVSPPLQWSDVPEGTAELVLIVEDIDGVGGTMVHWALFGVDPTGGGIEEGKVPAGAVGGRNDFGRTDWSGPCPTWGIARPHRYTFTLLALSEPSGLAEGASPRNDLPYALSGKVLAQAQLTGKYARQR